MGKVKSLFGVSVEGIVFVSNCNFTLLQSIM